MTRIHAAMLFVIFTIGVSCAGYCQAPAADPTAKLPVPSSEQQKKALDTLNEVFNLGKKRTDKETITLAREILKMAGEVKGRPAERFPLLRKAMELASDGGDAALMVQIVGVIGDEFQIDALTVQGKMLNAFAAKANSKERIESLVAAAKTYVDQAAAAGQFDFAASIAATANRVSQRPSGKDWRKETLELRKEVERLRSEHEQLQAAQEALEANPKDPAANLAVGSVLCFTRGDWKGGLLHLSRGSDAELSALAQREMAAPTQPADQVRLADGWWQLAEARKGRQKTALLMHAGEWYHEAQSAATGLTKVKADKRLAELARLTQPKTKPVRAPRVPPAIPAAVFWLMADDMDIYHNGKPLREYTPSFRTRPDEARKKKAYSAKIELRAGDIFTIGGRRGGAYGGTVVVTDANNRLIWCSNTTDWFLYKPDDSEKWFMPEVAMRTKQGPVKVANSYGYQAQMRRDYNGIPQPIWGEPSQRVVYMVGVYKQPKPASRR